MSDFLTPVQYIDLEFCNNNSVSFLFNWEFAFPASGTGVTPSIKGWSYIGQKERVQLVASHGGENNAAACDSPHRGGDKHQDGFSLRWNCSYRPLDLLSDWTMLIGPCT